MHTVLITGGTGLVGKALTKALLAKGHRVIILTRNPDRFGPSDRLQYAGWDLAKNYIDADALAAADFIVHLAGAGVAERRWSKKRKQEIVNSRVNSGRLIVTSLQTIPNKIKAVIAASAIGWYGADPVVPNPAPFTEAEKNNADFLGDTCRLWEDSIEPVKETGKRVVKLRIGIVLSKEGGALKEFLKPLRFGLAAILGNGKQVISWIHIEDLVRLFISAIENENMQGVYNAVAPHPVSNKELIVQLSKSRKKLYIPFYVPSFLLKIILGEMSIEVLKSSTVSAQKIIQQQFQFQFPDIKMATDNLVS